MYGTHDWVGSRNFDWDGGVKFGGPKPEAFGRGSGVLAQKILKSQMFSDEF